MSVDACVPGRAGQILSVSEWNVFTIRTLVAFGQSKINDVDSIFGVLVASHQKVVWLDVSMDNIEGVQE